MRSGLLAICAALVVVALAAVAIAAVPSSSGLQTRVKLLEGQVAALKARMGKVEKTQACVHSYRGVYSKGNGYTDGYQFKDPVLGATLTSALALSPSYAPGSGLRFALVSPSCSWPLGP